MINWLADLFDRYFAKCCNRPELIQREWNGKVGQVCNACGLWQRSPLE
jgi:hypothetical protein